MKVTITLQTLAVLLLALGLSGGGVRAAAHDSGSGPAQPNVLFILCDDLGINDLHCYGRQDHHTPNLDRLAQQGMRFTSAYCAQPICSPSRAAILTGKAPARLHLTTFLPGRPNATSQKMLHPEIEMQVPLREKMICNYLKDAGYATAAIGKWHVGGAGFGPREHGFDMYHAGKANTRPSETEGGKGEYDLTAAAEKFIEEHQDRPFFIYLAHNTPHIPYDAQSQRIKNNARAFEPVYAGVIETLDDTVGRLLAKLDALKMADKTIVVFTSDNGGLHVSEGPHAKITHNTPYRAGKGFVYEGGLRIPLIVRWPGHVPAGKVVGDPVINTDWVPTLLELVGRSVPAGLDGVSIAPLLTGHGAAPARKFFWHFPHYTNQGGRPSGAVRDGDWMMVQYYDEEKAELYDLRKDVGEARDLVPSQPERARQMRAALAAWRRQVGAQENTANPDFDPAKYRQLYVDLDASRFDPAQADHTQWESMWHWRKEMNAAVAGVKRKTEIRRAPAAGRVKTSAAKPLGAVRLIEETESVGLENRQVALTFSKQDGTLRSLRCRGRELLGPGRGYIQIAQTGKKRSPGNKPKGQWTYRFCRREKDLVEIAFALEGPDVPFDIEAHYLLRTGEPGFHMYLTLGHDARRSPGVLQMAQYNFCLRADPQIFTYSAVDHRRIAPLPTPAALAAAESVMDATYRLAEGRIYSKYFNSAVMDENHRLHGVMGDGLGLWIVMPSHEHLNGGPEHQELTVHQTDTTVVLLRHFNAAHYGAGQILSDSRDGSWSKASATWFVYVNAADKSATNWRDRLWRDANDRARREAEQWPYAWLDDARFQLRRGRVEGTLRMDDGLPAANARVILADHQSQPSPLGWQEQWRGYRFYGRTDAQGRFLLEKVRPGRYDLYAWKSGLLSQFFHSDVCVEAGQTLQVGKLEWRLPRDRETLWRIGVPDRSAAEFGFAEDFRRWGLWNTIAETYPQGVTFTVGRDDNRRWPFQLAVTQAADFSWRVPVWQVRFENVRRRTGHATLSLALAAFESNVASSAPQMTLSLNGQNIGSVSGLMNDGAGHRSGVFGLYQQRQISFDTARLAVGTNTLAITLLAPGRPLDRRLGACAASVLWDCLQLDVPLIR